MNTPLPTSSSARKKLPEFPTCRLQPGLRLHTIVHILDSLLITLKSLTTFLLLIAFGVGARIINGLASLLLKALTSPTARTIPTIAVPHEGSSTLNYLYTPPARKASDGDKPPTPLPQAFKFSSERDATPTKHEHDHAVIIPPRISLTESIKVWIWLTVDIAFDIPRYCLGTSTSHPADSYNFQSNIIQMENPQMTTSSVIRAAGYPLEEHALTTSDGYRLTMQRLPRKDATKIVFFMHGVLDTSLGWVCNGPIGSHAFTAHDSGADVWLGNCRANEGVGDKKKGGARSSYHDYLGYWAYSINELGLNDVEGMLGYIMRATEQQGRSKRDTTSNQEVHIVAHSLGAASVLIHLVFSKPESNFFQRIKQVILLAPAGFHSEAPFLALPFMRTVPPLVRVSNGLIGLFGARAGLPAYIPSRLLRAIAFKLATDFHSVPSLNELSRALLQILFNGDCSDWGRALQMPHYAASSMPALSVHTGAHLIQLIRRQKFELYDYGWKALNRRHYGQDVPPDVSDGYGTLADNNIRVHLVAGAYDGVIAKEDIKMHYTCMQRSGVDVTYTELDLGHLDVCFGGHEDVVRLVDAMLSSP